MRLQAGKVLKECNHACVIQRESSKTHTGLGLPYEEPKEKGAEVGAGWDVAGVAVSLPRRSSVYSIITDQIKRIVPT